MIDPTKKERDLVRALMALVWQTARDKKIVLPPSEFSDLRAALGADLVMTLEGKADGSYEIQLCRKPPPQH